MRKKKSKKLHPTGQLSIFIVLVFQALFVLFAMSLNVALVVHDKINLQNSVDIAAYYGAMKQAEMMNAIGHINYQIRQSWKLLAWRYRVLGSMGVTQLPNPGNMDSEHDFRVFRNPPISPGPYFFCVGHEWWGGLETPGTTTGQDEVNEDDNLCTQMNNNISAVSVPSVGGTLGTLGTFLRRISGLSSNINAQTMHICRVYGFNSWLLGIMSFFHFRIDQSNRKFMIKRLAETLRDGKDLDKGAIAEGVIKTFKKNLSYINEQNFDSHPDSKLEQFSSLEGRPPQEWLADEPFFDLGLYARLEEKPGGGCIKNFDWLNNPPAQAGNTVFLTDAIGRFSNWPCNDPNACNPSAGLHKQKNFLVFYSVRAEIPYKNQIFLPLSRDITLKAKAYAKPFGGIIGPPPIPNTDQRTDNHLPPSYPPTSPFPSEVDRTHTPNYSRYPGDPFGLRSRSVHYHWLMKRNIRNSPDIQKNVKYYTKENYHSPSDNDPLAKNFTPGGQYGMGIPARAWEVEAISPDLFDVTYFTILPHYQHAYFPKIIKLFGPQDWLRADLGMTRTGLDDFTGKILLDQVNKSSQNGPFYVIQNRNRNNTYTSLPNKPTLLLSGWNPPKQKYKDNNYDPGNPSNFGKCFHWASLSDLNNPLGKIANGCVYGGRSGYSVKMVSDDFLKELEIDGGFSATNPKPSWWNE